MQLFNELMQIQVNIPDQNGLKRKRDPLRKWILKFPLKNNLWSGYCEDVNSDSLNLNQQNPMETARYILRHPEMDANLKEHVPALIAWIRNRFGETKHYGATSIREQDTFFCQMSSNAARYASVVTLWYGVTGDPIDREEARASFALSTYSAYNKYSKSGMAINYVGID